MDVFVSPVENCPLELLSDVQLAPAHKPQTSIEPDTTREGPMTSASTPPSILGLGIDHNELVNIFVEATALHNPPPARLDAPQIEESTPSNSTPSGTPFVRDSTCASSLNTSEPSKISIHQTTATSLVPCAHSLEPALSHSAPTSPAQTHAPLASVPKIPIASPSCLASSSPTAEGNLFSVEAGLDIDIPEFDFEKPSPAPGQLSASIDPKHSLRLLGSWARSTTRDKPSHCILGPLAASLPSPSVVPNEKETAVPTTLLADIPTPLSNAAAENTEASVEPARSPMGLAPAWRTINPHPRSPPSVTSASVSAFFPLQPQVLPPEPQSSPLLSVEVPPGQRQSPTSSPILMPSLQPITSPLDSSRTRVLEFLSQDTRQRKVLNEGRRRTEAAQRKARENTGVARRQAGWLNDSDQQTPSQKREEERLDAHQKDIVMCKMSEANERKESTKLKRRASELESNDERFEKANDKGLGNLRPLPGSSHPKLQPLSLKERSEIRWYSPLELDIPPLPPARSISGPRHPTLDYQNHDPNPEGIGKPLQSKDLPVTLSAAVIKMQQHPLSESQSLTLSSLERQLDVPLPSECLPAIQPPGMINQRNAQPESYSLTPTSPEPQVGCRLPSEQLPCIRTSVVVEMHQNPLPDAQSLTPSSPDPRFGVTAEISPEAAPGSLDVRPDISSATRPELPEIKALWEHRARILLRIVDVNRQQLAFSEKLESVTRLSISSPDYYSSQVAQIESRRRRCFERIYLLLNLLVDETPLEVMQLVKELRDAIHVLTDTATPESSYFSLDCPRISQSEIRGYISQYNQQVLEHFDSQLSRAQTKLSEVRSQFDSTSASERASHKQALDNTANEFESECISLNVKKEAILEGAREELDDLKHYHELDQLALQEKITDVNEATHLSETLSADGAVLNRRLAAAELKLMALHQKLGNEVASRKSSAMEPNLFSPRRSAAKTAEQTAIDGETRLAVLLDDTMSVFRSRFRKYSGDMLTSQADAMNTQDAEERKRVVDVMRDTLALNRIMADWRTDQTSEATAGSRHKRRKSAGGGGGTVGRGRELGAIRELM